MTTITIERAFLIKVLDQLDIAQSLLERSQHHAKMAAMYEELRAALAPPATAPEQMPLERDCICHQDLHIDGYSGGAAPEGLYGALWVVVEGVGKKYVLADQSSAPKDMLAPATAPEPSTEVAVGKLCKSLREDLDYAWTWHCNIAMAAFDAGCPHDVANEGAARFMQLLAGVDTREHPAFQGTQDHPMRNDKTAPAQPAPERKPMTEELIEVLYGDSNFDVVAPSVIAFARAVEAFHGIKEQP